MKILFNKFSPLLMLLAFYVTCSAGPTVVTHPNSEGITIKVFKSDVERELKDQKQIKIIQDAFLRAKIVGDTNAEIENTHVIDFSDRWFINVRSGEFYRLSKAATHVYQLNRNDLKAIKDILEPKAEE